MKVECDKGYFFKMCYVVMMKGVEMIDDLMVIIWDVFMVKVEGMGDIVIDDCFVCLDLNQVVTFIYMLGMIGFLKVVMLSYSNLMWMADVVVQFVLMCLGDKSVLYLLLLYIVE